MGLLSLFNKTPEQSDPDDTRPLTQDEEDAADLASLPGASTADAPRAQTIDELKQKIDPESTDLKLLLLSTLMEMLPDAVYFKDLFSRFLMINTTLARKNSSIIDPLRVVGKTDFDIFTKEHAQPAYEDEQRIIATEKPIIGFEEKETWPDGHVTWVKTSKFPLRDKNGQIIGTWGYSRDITESKRTEEELRKSEEKLRHSQKMEAFGQLAGGIAHDFNNMLSVIMGASQLIDMELGETNPMIKRNADMIIDTAKKAANLTQQLLAFARKGNIKVVPLDMHDVIHSVVNLLSHTIDKRIRTIERPTSKHSTVMGDYAQLQNALLNLGLNARDAMQSGGTLTFSTDTIGPDGENTVFSSGALKEGSYIRIQVIDTGSGMDAVTKQRAFEPFFTTKEPGKGTGLGLASVYGTVKSHNGLIELESEVGKGTTFTIFLPLSHQQEEKATEPRAFLQRGSAKIMVVDDEQDIRTVLSEMLKNLGHTPVTCKDGLEAVEYYKIHHAEIDLIIIDMLMPRMNGNDCIKYLKRINPSVRILVGSGYSLASDTKEIITKGIAGFIQKPFQLEDLSRMVGQALSGKK